jgi:hypothetical protein
MWPEPTDHLVVVFVPRGAVAAWQEIGEKWLTPPDHPAALPTVVVERESYAVHWRPGKALVLGWVENPEALLAALMEFAFCEGELRVLEAALATREASATADVDQAHRIRFGDRKHWPVIGAHIEQLARMRLLFARLEPRLGKPTRAFPVEARRILARLLARADVDTRLEGFSSRLEACEDLYEGANDRIAEYRWYLEGHVLEIIIILLLGVEVVLMAADLYLRLRECSAL